MIDFDKADRGYIMIRIRSRNAGLSEADCFQLASINSVFSPLKKNEEA